MPFLTQIDSRAQIRGSRDPLSLVPIWAAFGRLLVGNLTTASTSLRGFTTVLLGYYLADRVREKTPDENALNVFLRVEQLVGYCRNAEHSKDTDFRGSEQVVRRLRDSRRVTLSADPRHQILGDQKTYGLWGLYSVASRTSGFLLPDRPSLTQDASTFVERQYIAKLTRAGLRGVDALLNLVAPASKDIDLERSSRDLGHVVAQIHSPRVNAEERRTYQEHLVEGGQEQSTDGHQRVLAELLDEIRSDDFGMADLVRLIRLAEKKKLESLRSRLVSVQRVESLIVPAASLFGFLLRNDGRSVSQIEADVRSAWGQGLRSLTGDLSDAVEAEVARFADAPEIAVMLGGFGRSAREGDWSTAIRGLIELNAFVMKRRGGAAWVRLEQDRIVVGYREEGADLAEPAALAQAWRNTYFINALHGIKRELARD